MRIEAGFLPVWTTVLPARTRTILYLFPVTQRLGMHTAMQSEEAGSL